jgi:DNA-binding GntR family transcriptional regulator
VSGKTSQPSNGERSLSDEVCDYIRLAIVEGKLTPGQRLVEATIAESTSVSRTPVREAFRKLASSGLIRDTGHGFIVATLTSTEFRELWEVMEELYVLAVQLVARRGSDIDVIELKHTVEKMLHEPRDENLDAVELNQEFRMALYRAAGNSFLAETQSAIITRLESLQDFTAARNQPDIEIEHAAVLEAIERRDPEAAGNAMRRHLRSLLLETLRNMSVNGVAKT